MTTAARFSEAQKEAVLIQTERLATSPYFRGSTRYPSFLKFIVEQTLEGQESTLKERTLGIEVFGRAPGFDTSGDPIVRVAAAEVRKRVAQYYQEPGHENETRIDLHPGSYVPHFVFATSLAEAQNSASASDDSGRLPSAVQNLQSPVIKPRLKRPFLVALGLIIGIALLGGIARHFWDSGRTTVLDSMRRDSSEVTVCVGVLNASLNVAASDLDPRGNSGTNSAVVPFGDTLAISRLQGEFAEHHQKSRITECNSMTYEVLRRSPTVLIGAYDNDWTMRIVQGLRFRFANPSPAGRFIVDTKRGQNARWTIEYGSTDGSVVQDYAIAAMLNDNMLGQPVQVIAGIGPNGTMAASEFLSSNSSVKLIHSVAPPSWNGRNFEAVLSTQVVKGNTGPPRIVAAEFW
jgi:hypothetical protein